MLGGEEAIRSPAKMALSCLSSELPAETDELARLFLPVIAEPERKLVMQMLSNGIRCPATSSAGRLFDCRSQHCLGVCVAPRSQGEAAILLEKSATGTIGAPYPFHIEPLTESSGVFVRPYNQSPRYWT